jgi:hypothetical protein
MLNAAVGGNLTDRGSMERLGMQGLMAMGEMLANPERFVGQAMRGAEFEGDARADIMTFMQRHGCTNEINIPLNGAVHFYRNPPSQLQAQFQNARTAAQRSCNAAFDGGERMCACVDRALGEQNLSLEIWQALGSSFAGATPLERERSHLLSALRQCRS